MRSKELIDQINRMRINKLEQGLIQLDEQTRTIFRITNSEINQKIINELKRNNVFFYIWFCFLRANFLRSKDTISNRAFIQFIDYCNQAGNNFYFEEFPKENTMLPRFKNPSYQQAHSIEIVLQQIRDEYNSGCEFAHNIEKIAEINSLSNLHIVYIDLINELMKYKQIHNKIANAVVSELSWELNELRQCKETALLRSYIKSSTLHTLALASTFNVMIDVHIKTFFEDKLGSKDIDQSTIILLSRSIQPKIIKFLFARNYPFIHAQEQRRLLEKYYEYIAANMLEKLIWQVYFVKNNSKVDDYRQNTVFYQEYNDIFF